MNEGPRTCETRLRATPIRKTRQRPLNILTAPIIYSMVVPIALIDASLTIYQGLCFPLYGIAHVRRSVYVAAVDRRHLAYLNANRKAQLHVLRVRERRPGVCARDCGTDRVDYGDAEGYHRRLPMLREKLKGDQ